MNVKKFPRTKIQNVVRVDPEYGDDQSAAVNFLDKPFLTIPAALAAIEANLELDDDNWVTLIIGGNVEVTATVEIPSYVNLFVSGRLAITNGAGATMTVKPKAVDAEFAISGPGEIAGKPTGESYGIQFSGFTGKCDVTIAKVYGMYFHTTTTGEVRINGGYLSKNAAAAAGLYIYNSNVALSFDFCDAVISTLSNGTNYTVRLNFDVLTGVITNSLRGKVYLNVKEHNSTINVAEGTLYYRGNYISTTAALLTSFTTGNAGVNPGKIYIINSVIDQRSSTNAGSKVFNAEGEIHVQGSRVYKATNAASEYYNGAGTFKVADDVYLDDKSAIDHYTITSAAAVNLDFLYRQSAVGKLTTAETAIALTLAKATNARLGSLRLVLSGGATDITLAATGLTFVSDDSDWDAGTDTMALSASGTYNLLFEIVDSVCKVSKSAALT